MCTYMPEEGTRSRYIDGFEPPCGCWELYSGPLEEQTVLFTSEPSLQPGLLVCDPGWLMGTATPCLPASEETSVSQFLVSLAQHFSTS